MKTAGCAAADIRSQALIFKALGHPARLQMAMALVDGERCVCELTALVGLDMSTISKHLSVLTSAGVLAGEKRANKVFYRLRIPCVATVFDCLREARSAAGDSSPACCR